MYKVMNKQSKLYYKIEGFWKYWDNEGSLVNEQTANDLKQRFKNKVELIKAT